MFDQNVNESEMITFDPAACVCAVAVTQSDIGFARASTVKVFVAES